MKRFLYLVLLVFCFSCSSAFAANDSQMAQTIAYLHKQTNNFQPEIAIILGTGFGTFVENIDGITIKYNDIPFFPPTIRKSHKGNLIFTTIEGKKLVIMQGRPHYYEGYSVKRIVYPIEVFKELGVKTVIITNASGGLNSSFKPADLMLITDQINFTGQDSHIGPHDENLGPRCPIMEDIYSKDLQKLAIKSAKKLHIKLHKGVYVGIIGPCFETPAEQKMFKKMGADAVGMSTIHEAMKAHSLGLKVIGISCVTDVMGKHVTHEEIKKSSAIAKDKSKKLLIEIIKSL